VSDVRPMRLRQIVLFAGALFFLALALAARADAYVYWTNGGDPGVDPDTKIGRATNDGTNVNQSFIPNAGPGPCLLAADAAHLYWSNQGANFDGTTVGRSNLDGSAVNASFINGAKDSCGVAVDSTYIYWADGQDHTIGRANLDGSNPNPTFISDTGGYPCGITVDGSHIYWGTNYGNVGRADLSGSNSDPAFITGLEAPCGVAVDSSHIYWANDAVTSTTIGRANLDGNPASVDQNFITGGNFPCGVAVFNGKVYWGNFGSGTIGRANVDGSGVSQNFITGAHNPCGPVVDAPNPFSVKVKGKKLIVSVQSDGTVRVTDAAAPLSATAAKKKRKLFLKTSSASGKAPKITVKLKLTKLGTTKLSSKGKLKARARVMFSPQGGTAKTETLKLKIKGKRKKH
jgi:Low-density lipoprotein receptor repeat class B